MAKHRLFILPLAASALLGTLTACDPPPPRLQIRVTSDGVGRDAAPGDRRCATEADGQLCTLAAAIDEANASPTGADIALPNLDEELPPGEGTGPEPSRYYSSVEAVITGDVRITGDHGTRVSGLHLTVAGGAKLVMTQIRPMEGIEQPIWLQVDGTLLVEQSIIEANAWPLGALPALNVTASGSAIVIDSILTSDNPAGAVLNAGTLVAIRASIAPSQLCFSGQPTCFGSSTAINTTGSGQTHLAGSAALIVGVDPADQARCAGNVPVSHGFVHLETPCGGPTSPSDSSGPAEATYDRLSHALTASSTSPLRDAIPLDETLCADASIDVRGVTRGLDSNGDGRGGCDIGAVEN
ncbi:MAG: hypothetical protein KDB09_10885 [Acidimicrobiales bacterium]|nr:hypothetical protein [Acidimicrobiales bacterium]